MNDADTNPTELLEATLDRMFTAKSDALARQQAEAVGWSEDCWRALSDSDLIWLGIPEAVGGSGGTVFDACVLLRMAGRHAVALPLAECSLVGGWLIAAADLHLPSGPLSVAVPSAGDKLAVDPGGRVSGWLRRVPWGARAAVVAAVAEDPGGAYVILLDPSQVEVVAGRNVAGEPRDSLVIDQLAVPPEHIVAVPSTLRYELALRGALSRALLLAGAMETARQLTVRYAGERRQFGRPVGEFQAIEQRLVLLSSEAEAAALAAEIAARRFAEAGAAASFEVAAAKATASRAASAVALHAHQVHGAIGMTREYPLHHFTRRLWVWRQEWWSERQAATVVGNQAVHVGANGLWPLTTRGLAAS